jgi:hypothetical protein
MGAAEEERRSQLFAQEAGQCFQKPGLAASGRSPYEDEGRIGRKGLLIACLQNAQGINYLFFSRSHFENLENG